ncbi:hypothetical protein FHR99_002963 [Litorivivens lipolytica]|uniref:Cytochrome P460 domain-containing protein n=1 Tax=Litorivivens lipolytica TaxID=1524264 RepID=A0A7W4W886_9GAMM|nr:cytochrome P460 family protein [Litorivivens lipolytica]MBB3048689.1 hypothetical protein [Litorivivens lipolytica]
MWKRVVLSVVAVGLVSVAVALSGEDPHKVKLFDIPESDREKLEDYRQTWTRLTGFEYSGLHWNQFVVVYSDLGAQAYQTNYTQYIAWYEDPDEFDGMPDYVTYPRGTTILKENFSIVDGKPEKSLTVTAMIKREPGYDAENGDWEYLQFDAAGKVLLRGKGSDPNIDEQCASCHKHVAERDYIFAQVFSAPNRRAP